MKIRITIEYDPDWGPIAAANPHVLQNEMDDWANGHITTADVQSEGGTVKFEVVS